MSEIQRNITVRALTYGMANSVEVHSFKDDPPNTQLKADFEDRWLTITLSSIEDGIVVSSEELILTRERVVSVVCTSKQI